MAISYVAVATAVSVGSGVLAGANHLLNLKDRLKSYLRLRRMRKARR